MGGRDKGGYIITFKKNDVNSSDEKINQIFDITKNTIKITEALSGDVGLKLGEQYTITVVAYNEEGKGSSSEVEVLTHELKPS